MGRRQWIECLHCHAAFRTRLRGEVGFTPTGGDYDWCESRENKQCPKCRGKTEVTVRVWLKSNEIEIVGRRKIG